MIIKSPTSLHNDYDTNLSLAHEAQEPIYIIQNSEGDPVVKSIDAFEKQDELIRLRTKLKLAEQSRLAGEPTYMLEESKQRLDKIYERREV